MKQCPVCKTTYTDDSLSYCLTDGASLFSMPEPAETVQISPGRNPMQISIPPDSTPTFAVPKASSQPSGSNTGLIIAAVLSGLLFLIIAGAAGGYFLLKSSSETANNSVSPNSSKNTPNSNGLFDKTDLTTLTPNDETDELKEKIAKLEREIQEQKKQQNQTPSQSTPQNQTTSARVNSPGDGFLALRSEPITKEASAWLKFRTARAFK